MANQGNPLLITSAAPNRPSGKGLDPALKITTSPLNGSNYITWTKSASLYLCDKSKLGFVNEKISLPPITDPTYEEWEANNKIIMLWLFNSMEPTIATWFLFLDTVKEVWDSVEEIYGEVHNLARVYILQQKIARVTKGDRPFYIYLNNLKGM